MDDFLDWIRENPIPTAVAVTGGLITFAQRLAMWGPDEAVAAVGVGFLSGMLALAVAAVVVMWTDSFENPTWRNIVRVVCVLGILLFLATGPHEALSCLSPDEAGYCD